jgi:hypothetical protein
VYGEPLKSASSPAYVDSLGSLLRGTSSLFSPATLFGGFTGGHPGETMAEARVVRAKILTPVRVP